MKQPRGHRRARAEFTFHGTTYFSFLQNIGQDKSCWKGIEGGAGKSSKFFPPWRIQEALKSPKLSETPAPGKRTATGRD